jgi:hypothetical protein
MAVQGAWVAGPTEIRREEQPVVPDLPTPFDLTWKKVAILGAILGTGLLTGYWMLGLAICSLTAYVFTYLDQKLIETVEKGDRSLTNTLLFLGASPDAVYNGTFPLMNAAVNGNVEIARDLLEAGASVNLATQTGNATALHWAVFFHRLDIVRLLLEHGACLKIWARELESDPACLYGFGTPYRAAIRCLNVTNQVSEDRRSAEERQREAREIMELFNLQREKNGLAQTNPSEHAPA